ncbi:hypothetical protein JRO89_XS06G0107400 [Xanthoceras sorbifolium]|uniref:Serine-threonine/tyrosine-protein kinase catalytic domain-containing protein n=1 Tax=Xanthoceras sorbifolium TaxID=99658 RepID=A0ABQ8HXM0_9ROSI|nr:hypothetical protein JRO89_XS06G0107400 [Xanthoceras sorbifolium]
MPPTLSSVALSTHASPRNDLAPSAITSCDLLVSPNPLPFQRGALRVIHVSSIDQLADALTKPLSCAWHLLLCDKIGLSSWNSILRIDSCSYSVTLPSPQLPALSFGSRIEMSTQTKWTDSDQSTSKSMQWLLLPDKESKKEVQYYRGRNCGYMSPEYAMHGEFYVKSDVYSFGVLVLEIITGKKNSSFYQTHGVGNLLSYAWEHWRDETPMQLLDSNLTDSYSRNEVMRCIHVGLLCVQEDPAARPAMATVVHMLNSYCLSSITSTTCIFPL